MCSFQCRLRGCEDGPGIHLKCSRCKGSVDAQRARYKFAVTLQAVCNNDELFGIMVVGEKLDAVFGASADETMRCECVIEVYLLYLSIYPIFRTISKSKLSSDHVHAALEECFIGLWFHFSITIPQGRTNGIPVTGNPPYVSRYIRPVSTIQRSVIQQLRRQQYLTSLAPLAEKETNCPAKLSDECLSLPSCPLSECHEESVMLSTWDPSQPNTTQLEVEPYQYEKEGFSTLTSGETNDVETDTVSDKCINKESETGSFHWKWSLAGNSYDSFSLDKSLICLLSQTLDLTAEAQEGKADNFRNKVVNVLFPATSQLAVTLGSTDINLEPESNKQDLSDSGEGQPSWLKEFEDPVFCEKFFSPFHQECSRIESKQPEDWRQGHQVGKSSLSRLTINMQDRVLSGCTAASNSLPSGSPLQQSQTSGPGLWSESDELTSCLDIEPSYQHEHFKDLSVDSVSAQLRGYSPLCVSTPLHAAKKLCARVTPVTMKSWSCEPDCRSLLLFSESDGDISRTESELDGNWGVRGVIGRSHTPDLF